MKHTGILAVSIIILMSIFVQLKKIEKNSPPVNQIFNGQPAFIPSLIYDFNGNDYFQLSNVTESEVIIFDQKNLPRLADGYFDINTGELYIQNSRANTDTIQITLILGNGYWKNSYVLFIKLSDP